MESFAGIPSFRCVQRLSFFRLFRFQAEEQTLCFMSEQKDIDRELFYC
ncbi:hypothetical protein HMPREF1986_01944 [Oribacterium sp. oral taxon 078 str. F0263]|nr:hypothetical protein HMPREF1986_01944 [Oribacterium sp. oral taxon 078 str. F0263]